MTDAPPILCFGEALIDLVPTRNAAGEEALLPRPGGASLNVAIALARLGQRAALVAGISTDPFGTRLMQALHDARVETAMITRSELPSTLAAVHPVGVTTTFSFHDAGTAGRELGPRDLPAHPHAAALVFGGISLARAPSAEAFLYLVQTAHVQGPILFDPNIRPALVDDAAAYRATLAHAMGLSQIVKLSEEDIAWMHVVPADILASGPRLVLLTRGAGGVTAFAQGMDPLNVPAPQAEVIDTVGAGDCFVAGFLAALAERDALNTQDPETLHVALDFAVQAASLSVSRAGAQPPLRADLPG